jgi:hypothetical protein
MLAATGRTLTCERSVDDRKSGLTVDDRTTGLSFSEA